MASPDEWPPTGASAADLLHCRGRALSGIHPWSTAYAVEPTQWSGARAVVTEWRPSATPPDGQHPMDDRPSSSPAVDSTRRRCGDTGGIHSQPSDEGHETGGSHRRPEHTDRGGVLPARRHLLTDPFGRAPLTRSAARTVPPLDQPDQLRPHPLTTGCGTCRFPLTWARGKGKPAGLAARPASPDEAKALVGSSGQRIDDTAAEGFLPRTPIRVVTGRRAEGASSQEASGRVRSGVHRDGRTSGGGGPPDGRRATAREHPVAGPCPSTRCTPSTPVDGTAPMSRSPSWPVVCTPPRWEWGAPFTPLRRRPAPLTTAPLPSWATRWETPVSP